MADEIAGKLRDEIIESQKSRLDLLKWKIILVAALGAAALGVGVEKGGGTPSLLALVPWVCVFVDVICYHADVRIMVIGSFLSGPTNTDASSRAYEAFCHQPSTRNVFSMENAVLKWASYFASAMVCVVGWLLYLGYMSRSDFGIGAAATPDAGGAGLAAAAATGMPAKALAYLLIASGGAGLYAARAFRSRHDENLRAIPTPTAGAPAPVATPVVTPAPGASPSSDERPRV